MIKYYVLSIFFVLGLAHSGIAAAASDENQDETGSSSIIPLETVIQGKVDFKPRFTRVHESSGTGANGVGSPNSQIYWSIEVTSGPTRYVLNRRNHVGNPIAPDAIDLAGVMLRSGSLVEIEGKVVTTIPNYFVLLDVNKVTLLSDQVTSEPNID